MELGILFLYYRKRYWQRQCKLLVIAPPASYFAFRISLLFSIRTPHRRACLKHHTASQLDVFRTSAIPTVVLRFGGVASGAKLVICSSWLALINNTKRPRRDLLKLLSPKRRFPVQWVCFLSRFVIGLPDFDRLVGLTADQPQPGPVEC